MSTFEIVSTNTTSLTAKTVTSAPYEPLLVQDTLYNRYAVKSVTYGTGSAANILYVNMNDGTNVTHTFANAVEAQREFRLIAVMTCGR